MNNAVNLKKGKVEKTCTADLRELLLEALKDIENGSVTIIKQDNCIIQINKNEKYCLVS